MKFTNLVEVYRHAVDNHAGRPVIGTKRDGTWHWTTYAELGEMVDAMRGGLAARGVGRGDRVAIIADNRLEWAIAAYATYGVGAVFVPMYEAQLDEEWAHILGDSGARVVFAANVEIRDRLRPWRGDLPSLEHVVVFDGAGDEGSERFADLMAAGPEAGPELVDPDPDDLAGFIYTSGTTGMPKGVLLTHRNFVTAVNAAHQLFPMNPEDRSLSYLPWAHSFGQTNELHTGVSAGSSAAISARDTLAADLPEVKPTVLLSVPLVFNRIYDGLHKRMAEEGGLRKAIFDAALANAGRRQELAARGEASGLVELKHRLFDRVVFAKVRNGFGGRLKFVISGGAALSTEVAEFIEALGITVYEGYGLSETSPTVTTNWPGSRKIGSVGKPIPGVRVEIHREATSDDPDSDDGEIVVYGPNVMQGYHNLPAETSAVFTADGGLRTGDLGRFDEDGFLYITGRIKEQYKLQNGKYVVPTLIEEELKLSPYIAHAMVHGEQKPHNVAVVVPDLEAVGHWATERGITGGEGSALLDHPEVRDLLGAEIEARGAGMRPYERVRGFVLTGDDFTPENGTLTPTLKVKRRAVLERYGDRLLELYGG